MKSFAVFAPRQLQIMDLLDRAYPMPMHVLMIAGELNMEGEKRGRAILFQMDQAHRVTKCADAIYGRK